MDDEHFSPQDFVNVLSGASRLRSLSLHFVSFTPHPNDVGLPPPCGDRIVLPALTSFKYRGIIEYFDRFVVRIDAPRLGNIDITFLSPPMMDASQLGQFVERIDMQTSATEAEIRISADSISIFLQNSTTSTCLRLQIYLMRLDWRLSSMAQICDQISLFLFGVQHLIFMSHDSPSRLVDANSEQWVQLVRLFTCARTLSITGVLATGLLCALRSADGGYTTDTTVLPALRALCIWEHMPLDWPLFFFFFFESIYIPG